MNPRAPYRHSDLLEAMACETRVNLADILSPVKTQAVVRARNLVAYWLYRVCGFSYVEAARTIGRDHTTIIAGLRKIDRWREQNPSEARDLFESVARRLGLEWSSVRHRLETPLRPQMDLDLCNSRSSSSCSNPSNL